MKLKLQFTASVSNPPPDARPLSRKMKTSFYHLNLKVGKQEEVLLGQHDGHHLMFEVI